MQTTVLPKGICHAIERSMRRFIWGNDGPEHQTANMHLVNWETVTSPKVSGGLGLRKLQELNQAFMVKLGWRLDQEKDSLWAKVLSCKYKHGNSTNPSNAWRGLMAAAPFLDSGRFKAVRNGASTRFWLDNWIVNYPLCQHLTVSLSLPELYANVSDYWDEGRGWRWEGFSDHLPDVVLQKFAGFVLSSDIHATDGFGWSLETSGNFTLSSAYSALIPPPSLGVSSDWLPVWGIKVPNRICFFLWLVKHERIMTNVERARRHLTSNTLCGLCAGHQEDLDHLFRQCNDAKMIWKAALGPCAFLSLGRLDWDAWLTANLAGDKSLGLDNKWPEKFAIRCWWIWKWRNDAIFNGHSVSIQYKLEWIKKQEGEIAAAFQKQKTAAMRGNLFEPAMVSWTKPPGGWQKVNVDGSRSSVNGAAGCGGVLRDCEGGWQRGFHHHIGVCSIDEAELWGVLQGMRLASSLGVSKLMVECDSESVVRLLKSVSHSRGNIDNLVQCCMVEGRNFEEVCFNHIYREQNRLADALAKQSLSLPSGFSELMEVPYDLEDILFEDQAGASFHRLIPRSRGGVF